MKKYQHLAYWIIIIISIINYTFSSCTNPDKSIEQAKKAFAKDSSEASFSYKMMPEDTLDNQKNSLSLKEDSIRISLRLEQSQIKKKKLNAAGIYSYFYRDTFYIYDENKLLIAKKYFKPPPDNPNVNNVIEQRYWVEQSKLEGKLYVSLYIGDATPLKSYLINLTTNQIILENENYQTYLGSSSNKYYHLFETGTAASVRTFAIFNSDNELLKENGYYASVQDENQLKWSGNKLYYYDDYQKGTILPNNLPELKQQEVFVQKYYWINENDSTAKEFAVAFME